MYSVYPKTRGRDTAFTSCLSTWTLHQGVRTQISGWNDPAETDKTRTRSICSRSMIPSPIFYCRSIYPPMACPWGLVVSRERRGIPRRYGPIAIDSRYRLSCELSGRDSSHNPRWRSGLAVSRRQHEWVSGHHLS